MKKSTFITIAASALLSLGLVGCKKFDTPEYKEIAPNETAFVVPLEGDTSSQAKFDSADSLKQHQVADKRIQITHRWSQTGYNQVEGEYIPTIKVIIVDRTPVTRRWESPDPKTGNGIWVESSDSVGFSTGFEISAMIKEEDAATFLYTYAGNPLSKVIDEEIHARVQGVTSEVASKYIMDDLRSKKQEIIDAVKSDVIPFFKSRGISVTTISQLGGFTYENKDIQASIDKVFQAQQLKNVAKAELEAQKDINEKLKQEGEGEASKAQAIALGIANAAKIAGDGEAYRIQIVAKAAHEAGSDPTFLSLQQLDVQRKQIEKWSGIFPQTLVTSSNGVPMILNMNTKQ